jgi:hypothetical protein
VRKKSDRDPLNLSITSSRFNAHMREIIYVFIVINISQVTSVYVLSISMPLFTYGNIFAKPKSITFK